MSLPDEPLSLPDESEGPPEAWSRAFDALLREDYSSWDAQWPLLRDGLDYEEAKEQLKALGGEESRLSQLSAEARARLRAAYADMGLVPPRPLLVPGGPDELEQLLAAPPELAGYTAFVLLADDNHNWLAHVPEPDRAPMRERARKFLFSAPPATISAYVHAARPHLDTDPAFLSALFKPYSLPAAALMHTLLTTTVLGPDDWSKLCADIGLTQDRWGNFLLESDRLANLLVGLGGEGVGKDVWDGYLGLLTPALVSPDLAVARDGADPAAAHAWERKVHNHLNTAAERLTADGNRLAPALSEGGAARLFAANNLIKWVDDPASAERDGSEEVRHACETFGIDRLDLVRVAYKKGGYDKLNLSDEADRLDPIVSLFSTCSPMDGQGDVVRAAVAQWLKLSQDCPEPERWAFQARFVLKCVPDAHYTNLLDETREHPFDPRAEEAIRQAIPSTLEQPAPPPAPPAPPPQPVIPTITPAIKSATRSPDACPLCGRVIPGRPGERYCMICDCTY